MQISAQLGLHKYLCLERQLPFTDNTTSTAISHFNDSESSTTRRLSQASCRNLQQNIHSLKMESRNVPYDSVVLSPEDAQALFAVINRTSGTIHWPSVASDIGTTVEIV